MAHPYGSMGDQNWQGDDATLKQSGSHGLGTRNGSAHSPRRRKSLHKPSRAPMDGDLPAACPPCMQPPFHDFGAPMGMLPLVPGTPPMDCCFYLHPAAMGLKPLSPDEVPPPPPPPPEDDLEDATELELVVAEAMMTCKVPKEQTPCSCCCCCHVHTRVFKCTGGAYTACLARCTVAGRSFSSG